MPTNKFSNECVATFELTVELAVECSIDSSINHLSAITPKPKYLVVRNDIGDIGTAPPEHHQDFPVLYVTKLTSASGVSKL
jgi:hypothetical protein